MDKILAKLKTAVAQHRGNGPAIQDVHSATLSFRSYRWVLAAVFLVALYYVFIASDRYVTVTELYVKSTDTASSNMPQLQLLGGAQSEAQDARLLAAYATSYDMLQKMEEQVGFSDHFTGNGGDFYSRLSSDASDETTFLYFKDRLSVSTNPDSGLITIRGQGYTPDFSLRFVQAIVAASEDFMNDVGHKIAKEEIAFVEQEVERARDALDKARLRLIKFQNDNSMLSLEAKGASLQGLVNEMESDLVRLKTEEKALASYLNEGSAELITVKARITALADQLDIEKTKLASQDTVSLSNVSAEYQALEMDLKFATDLYQATIVALERARVDSHHKLKHLVVVQSPQLPEDPKYPRKIYDLISIFIGLSLAYGIVTMILATIREHRDV